MELDEELMMEGTSFSALSFLLLRGRDKRNFSSSQAYKHSAIENCKEFKAGFV